MESQKPIKEPLYTRKRACLNEMKEIIRLIGPWNVNKSALSRKHNLDWRAVDAMFTRVLSRIPHEAIENIKVMGEASIKASMALCERLLIDPSSSVKNKLEAIQKMNETLKHYTEFLEQYNMKAKVADEINLGVSGVLDVERIAKIAQDSKVKK